jgi:hypothetical protein
MHRSPDTHCRKLFATEEERRMEIVRAMEALHAEEMERRKRKGIKIKPFIFENEADRLAATYYTLLQVMAERWAKMGRPVRLEHIPDRYRLENLYGKRGL